MAHNPSTSFELVRLNPGLSADPASGRAGEMYYNNVLNRVRYFDGSLWQDFGGTWANQNLSNLLGPTAINQDLLPDTTLLRNLGSASLVWAAASIQGLNQVTTISDLYTSGIQISSQNTTGSDNSGILSMITGDSVNGATGGILIRTGSPSGGTTVFKQQIGSFGSASFNFDTSAIGTNIAGVQLVAGSNGVLSSIVFKLQNATATPDTYSVQALVYSDSSGTPGTLITSSTVQFIPLAGSATSDETFTFQAPVNVVSGQTYYFLLTAQSFASTLNMLGSASSVSADNFTSSTNGGGSWTTAAFPDPYYILYNSPTRGTIDLDGGVTRLMNQSPLRFMNPGSTNYVALRAPTTIATNVTWTLPSADGTANQALVTDSFGNLSFATVSTPPGGTTGSVQFNTGGAFGGDSTNFFWDNSSKKLGIRTNAPAGALDVKIAGSTQGAYFLTGHSGSDVGLAIEAGAFVSLQGTNGTLSGAQDLHIQDTGNLYLHALKWVTSDGTAGQAITTNGLGVLGWTSVASSTGTANTVAAYNSSGVLGSSAITYISSSNHLSFVSTTSGGHLQFGKVIPGGGAIAASADGSFAFGQTSLNGAAEILAQGIGSMAMGAANSTGQIHATGQGSFAGGLAQGGGPINTITASGSGSFSFGRFNGGSVPHTASGAGSFNTGESNTTSGDDAFTSGMGHLNGSYAAGVFGRWSDLTGATATSWVTTDPLFVVGIGASAASRANAFKIQKDGKLFILDPSLSGASVGYTWTLQNVTTGEGAWAAASSGANTALSNLTTTAINQDLIWAFTGGATKTLRTAANGAASITGDNLLLKSGDTGGNNSPSGSASLKSGDVGNANSGAILIASGTVASNSGVSGSVTIATGNNSGISTSGSGSISIQTGTVGGGSQVSGNITLLTGTGATRGTLRFNEASLGAASNGYVWTLADQTTGRGAWAAATGGANTALSNLTATSINQDLVPATALTESLGSGSKPWLNLFNQFSWAVDASSNIKGLFGYWSAGIRGGAQVAVVGTDNNVLSIPVGLQSQDANGGGAAGAVWVGTGRGIPSADLNLFTGNYFNFATEQTGHINITTGNANIGNRGDVIANMRHLKIQDQSLSSASNGYIWTLIDQSTGEGGWSVASGGGSPEVEYRTLTSGEASANQLTLSATPANPAKVVLDILDGGGSQEYSVEYTVTGAVLDWSAGPLAGTLVAGNRFRIMYWT